MSLAYFQLDYLAIKCNLFLPSNGDDGNCNIKNINITIDFFAIAVRR